MPVPDGALTEYEIENVSREVKDHVELLAEEMEMEYSLEEAKSSRRPTQDLAYSLIADFAESKDGTRSKLVQFLRSANFPDTARRLEKCNIIAHFLGLYIIFHACSQTSQRKDAVTNICYNGFGIICYCISS